MLPVTNGRPYRKNVPTVLREERCIPRGSRDRRSHGNHSPAISDQSGDRLNELTLLLWNRHEVER